MPSTSDCRSTSLRPACLAWAAWLALAAPAWGADAGSSATGADADALAGPEGSTGSRGDSFSPAELDLPMFGSSAEADVNSSFDADPTGGTPLYLDVYFDERASGLLAEVRRRGGRLYMTLAGLAALNVVPTQRLQTEPDGWLAIDSVPGLSYDYDVGQQRLVLHVAPELRAQQNLGYQRPGPVQADRSHGLLVGWDAYGRHIDHSDFFSLATRWRWFGRLGALEVTGVSRAGDGSDAWERLDTHWSYSDSERMTTATVGDLASGGLAWTRPVRLGGLQYRRNFATRPDLITYPMPSFSGQATLPSAVELLVDNVRQFGSQVNDGPFVIDQFPRISGAGEVTLMVTDALGRVTQTTVPLYVDYQRLAPGLSDFSVEVGRLREGFGGGNDHYGDDWLGSASYRRGLTESFTIEGHAEGGGGLSLLGVGAVWSPAARYGVFNAAYAVGGGDSQGSLRSLGYQWHGRQVGFDVHSERRSAGLRDLGDAGDPLALPSAPRELDRFSAWAQLNRGSLGYTWLRSVDSDGRRERLHSLSWSRSFSDFSLSASAFDSNSGGLGVSVSFTMPLGMDRSFSVTANHAQGQGTDIVADYRKDAPYSGGWGYDLQAGERGRQAFGQATASVRGEAGEASFGVDRQGSQTGAFMQAGGSLVWMAGHGYASRRVSDAVGLVDTGGVAGVPVLIENRLYGSTNAHGFLLLPELRGWQRNRVAIDPDALGADYSVPSIEQFATPADNGGVHVRFALERVHPALLTLLDRDGRPVPMGSLGRMGENEVLVGLDGQAYVEDLPPKAVLEVDLTDHRCRYTLPATGETSGMATLGPLPCEVMP